MGNEVARPMCFPNRHWATSTTSLKRARRNFQKESRYISKLKYHIFNTSRSEALANVLSQKYFYDELG